ncbi:hypothetical protein CPC08DRAFT_107476 [Agrocybe pediades]|nr:hypothetical protein CPC08DRAFT_107476 [Agrocybe pediades]
MSFLTARKTFYGVVLSLLVCECAFAYGTAYLDGFSTLSHPFGILAGSFSIVSVIWKSVLLAFHNHPTSSHFLTKACVHFWSFLADVLIYLAFGIMILSQAPTECNFKTYSDGLAGFWCGITATAGTLGILVSVFCFKQCLRVGSSRIPPTCGCLPLFSSTVFQLDSTF